MLCLLMLVGAIAFVAVCISIYSPTPSLGFKFLQVGWAGFWNKQYSYSECDNRSCAPTIARWV